MPNTEKTPQRTNKSPIQLVETASRRLVTFISALSLLLVTGTILASIVIRSFRYDNSWSYDGTLYSLQWLAFVGAAYTAYRGSHITAGIAIENIFPRLSRPIAIIRIAVIAIPLIGFTIIGAQQAFDSFVENEMMLDTLAWPVWISRISIPIGMGFWFLASILSLFTENE